MVLQEAAEDAEGLICPLITRICADGLPDRKLLTLAAWRDIQARLSKRLREFFNQVIRDHELPSGRPLLQR